MERLIPSGLEMRDSGAHGRGLFSKSETLPGTELVTSQPFAHVVSSSRRESVCSHCLRASESLLKCSQCKYIYYCGKSCQKRDWSLHKAECKSLVSIRPHAPSDTMRLVVRVLQRKKTNLKKKRKKKEEVEELSLVTADLVTGQEIDYLCSNKDSLSEDVKKELDVQMIGVNRLMSCDPDYAPEDAYEVLCKVLCNTFYVLDWGMDAVAAALYLVPSLLNHSCDPNCVVAYNGLQLSLRTIKLVKPGEQLFIAYTELMETRDRRQSHLNRVYSFNCSCDRCLSEDEVATGLLAAAREGVDPREVKDSVREGTRRIDKDIDGLKKANDWHGVLDLCQKLISRYKALLSPLNIVMIKLYQEKLEAELELQRWNGALETAEHLLQPYQNFLSKYHPTVAVHLMKIAKLRRVLATSEQLELSISNLSQALDVLRASHGSGHPLTGEVELLLHDSRGELERRQSKS